MRLHRLEVTAFGPFSGTVTVDFDRLSEAGLFLLSGATGAGKTSVLDAVCFALYGDVPGDRSTAKRLRADQAEPDLAPRVELEATLSARRFRIVRTPAWQRAKKRGAGTTTAQASVLVAERVRGEWVTLATRHDEAGLLVSGLVGMNLTQFTQVAMLPQGRFQTFLRARSEDRHRLLHQLFRTGRFEALEGWLRDRRVTLRRASEAAHRTLADTVSRTSEAVAAPLPEGWDVADLAEPAGAGALSGWATGLVDDATARSAEADAQVTRAADAETAARRAFDEGRALAARQHAVATARARAAELAGEAVELAELQVALEAAARAASVRPAARIALRTSATLAAARVAAAGIEHDRDQLRTLGAEAAEAAAAVAAARPREAEVRGLTASIEVDEERLARLPVLARAADLQALVAVGERHERFAVAVDAARAAHVESRGVTLDLREEVLELRRARIEGMAAELAGALAVGAHCPVCGSAEHPHPAVPAPGAPDDAAEKAATKALDTANVVEHLRATELRDLETTLAGVEPQPLAALRAEIRELDAPADLDVDALRTEQVRLQTSLEHRHHQRAAAAAEVAEVMAGHDAPDLATLLHQHQATARAAAEAGRALDRLDDATLAHTEAETALAEALAVAGFATREDAEAAELGGDEVERTTARLRAHERGLAEVAAVLGADDVAEVTAAPAPDVAALTRAHADALDALTGSRSAADRWTQRAGRLAELATALDAALAAWRPLHEEWQLVAELSAFCEGKSGDNRLQMRLSAYVLAFRLAQVVAAANERLGRMSDERYTLEHSSRPGAGETRGGLSLRVRDDWSGEARDPATLSGGETFVVSLALALGLADVITQEAGGADLDTLFVDEGFGSLDADTLDHVLDTLDALRDGGRVVGVVSHVAEMRHRIPTQLVVGKARSGSTLTVVGHDD